jgi:hypothetical protein
VNKRSLLLPFVLILSAFALVACGGGSSDESQIEEAIEKSATNTDPANCTELQTQEFTEQTTQDTGKAALKECEREAEEPDNSVDSAKVTNIAVDGSTATADASLRGSDLDGQTVEIALVNEDDQWKLDQLTGFAKFDPAKLLGQFTEQLQEPESGLNPGQASCFLEGLEEASAAELEELVLDSSAGGFAKLAEGCL